MASYLIHSAKGTKWRKHKYIKKEGNRYVYRNPVRRVQKTKNDNSDDIVDKFTGLIEYAKNSPERLKNEFNENPLKFIMDHPKLSSGIISRYVNDKFYQEYSSIKSEISNKGKEYIDKISNFSLASNNKKDINRDISNFNKRKR